MYPLDGLKVRLLKLIHQDYSIELFEIVHIINIFFWLINLRYLRIENLLYHEFYSWIYSKIRKKILRKHLFLYLLLFYKNFGKLI